MTYRGPMPPGAGGFPGQQQQQHQQQQQQQQQYAQQQQASYQSHHQNYGLQPQQHYQQSFQQQQQQPNSGLGQQQQFYHPQQQHGQYYQPIQVSQPYGVPGMNAYSGYPQHGGLSSAGDYGVQLAHQPAAAGYAPPPQVWQSPIQRQQQQPHHAQHHQHPHHDIYNSPSAPSPRVVQQQLQQQAHLQSPQQHQHQQLPTLQSSLPQQQVHQPITPTQVERRPQLPQQQPPPQPPQQQPGYVNLQEIQQQPPYQQSPLMGNTIGTVKREETLEEQKPIQSYAQAPAPRQPQGIETPVRASEPSAMGKPEFPKPLDTKMGDASRAKSSPRSSISNSPAPSTRSPSISKKSPAVPPKTRPFDTVPVMMAIAEECIAKARAAVHDVAMSMQPDMVDEYQKLIATSLACFEAALQSNRLSPREEARVRLRYAAILQEETENQMEAETTLSKGITLCDKHRLFDLKYSMQHLLLKVLFQRNQKAALIAVDRHISDCEAFKHVQWYYSFRLLKALFYIEIGNASDASAFDNIRSIQNVAISRGDNALSVYAALLEALTLLKMPKDGSAEKVQACLAHVGKFQLDPSVQIVQLSVLTSLIEVASMLNVQHPDVTAQSLRSLQKKMDECDNWHNVKAEFMLPVKRQPSAAKTISNDTAPIIRSGGANNDVDFLVMSFMTKMELRSLVFTLSGLASLHKPVSQSRRSTELWREGIKILDAWDNSTAGIRYGPSISLDAAIRQRTWRLEAQAYLNILLALLAASHCQWDVVKQSIAKIEAPASSTKQIALKLLSLYLSGVYYQGTGDIQAAARVFSDARFDVTQGNGAKAGENEIALLASMNRLWIMQHPSCRDDQATLDLIELLQPLCANHPNIELRIAWHNVAASLITEPPRQMNQRKQHMHAAIAGTKITNNFLGAAVTLCIMRSRFFENVIGEQALKSALAAAKQAQKSGNLLWQSVADAMLAQSYEVQGQRVESAQEWEKATREAKDAFARSL